MYGLACDYHPVNCLTYVQDPCFFLKAHQKAGRGCYENYTGMRVLYYPPLPPSSEIQPGQLRCGEHIDYGSISLLFQDPNRVLQVINVMCWLRVTSFHLCDIGEKK